MNDATSARLLREIFLAGFMSGLPAENVAWAASRLAGVMSDVHLRAGDVLYRAGDLAPDHFFLVDGEVKLETKGSPTWTLGSHSLIGVLDVMLDRPRSRTVTATRDTHLFRVPSGDWFDMLEDNFELARRAVQGLARTVHQVRVELDEPSDSDDDAGPRSLRTFDPPPLHLGLIDRIFALRSVPLLAEADVQAVTTLADLAREVEIAPGETFLPRGEPNDSMLLVLSGEVTTSRAESSPGARFGPGKLVFGSASVSSDDLGYDARAEVATRALRIGHEDFFDVMEEHFPLARSVMKALSSERERLMNERGGRAARLRAPGVIRSPSDTERQAP